MTDKPPKRRWFQYSLRTLLIGVVQVILPDVLRLGARDVNQAPRKTSTFSPKTAAT